MVVREHFIFSIEPLPLQNSRKLPLNLLQNSNLPLCIIKKELK